MRPLVQSVCACGRLKRRTSSGRWSCDPCNSARVLAYRNAHLDVVREKDRLRAAALAPEERRQKHKNWRDANRQYVRDTGKAVMARLYASNPEKFRARSADYYRKNRDALVQQMADGRKSLVDSYVRTVMGMRKAQASPEIVQAQRELITLRRLAKQLKQAITNQLEKQHGN